MPAPMMQTSTSSGRSSDTHPAPFFAGADDAVAADVDADVAVVDVRRARVWRRRGVERGETIAAVVLVVALLLLLP